MATGTRVVVLGAAGFIGRHVCQALVGDVVQVARAPGTGIDAVVDLATTPIDDLRRLFKGSDLVVNCAGATHGTTADLVRGNVVAVSRMLEAIGGLPIPPRLVHLASAAEYGGRTDATPIRESDTPAPVGAYGITKLAGTELVASAGLDAVALRPFNVSGPGSPASTLLGRVADELRRGNRAIRLGSLDAWRDYVDVRDVTRAVLLAATKPSPPVLNVGRGEAVHARDVVHQLVEVSGTGAAVTEETGGEGNHAGSAASDVRWQRADTAAIRRELGWSPQIDVAQSIRDTWNS